jgi:5-methylcytosine-specific restriction endonuclease McrA
MKTCSHCKEIKLKTEFNNNKTSKDGLQIKCKSCIKDYYEANKVASSIRSKTYYAMHQETLKVAFKVYGTINKSVIAKRRKAYRLENIEKLTVKNKSYYENNKVSVSNTNKAWVKANPERKLASNHKRRCKNKKTIGNFTSFDINKLMVLQQFKCVYCQIEFISDSKNNYHIDHIIPLSLGGSNFASNIQLLCPKCNCSKGGKHPEEYERLIGFTRVSNGDVSLLKEKPVNEL